MPIDAMPAPGQALPVDPPSPLLGGLSPRSFMRRHWHKQPLMVPQALPGVAPPLSRSALFRLAALVEAESRLIVREGRGARAAWTLRHGPLPRSALPPLSQRGWTVLVQGLNLHVPAAQELLSLFRFVPQARLDDLMVSWASEGGGVGPHIDSYDVFLLQVQGRRRWRIAPPGPARLRPGLPVKILARFEPTQSWVLEPGDMLYLPPLWQHDGEAVDGECMTCSVGFRAPTQAELVRETLLRLADGIDDEDAPQLYRDPRQAATAQPGEIPAALQRFARQGLQRLLADPAQLARALGEYLSEPKPQVAFTAQPGAPLAGGVRLAPGSSLLYDAERVYMNGESWTASGRDAALLRRLADHRLLDAAALRRASRALQGLLADWGEAGWVQALDGHGG